MNGAIPPLPYALPAKFWTYLLTSSMVQSLSWEAKWFAASQEIPRISRNPKVHYRTHKRPPPVPILNQPSPVHISTSHIILSTHLRLGLPIRLFPSGFLTKILYTPSPHPHAPHVQPISFFSILSPAQYWVRSTNLLNFLVTSSFLPVWFYHIFPYYLIKDKTFREKVTEYKMCVLISVQFF